jgi:hypothetical protein
VALGCVAAIRPAFADENSDLQKVMAQTSALESQVTALNKEIRVLKAEQKKVRKINNRAMRQTTVNTSSSYYPIVSSPKGTSSTNFPISYLTGTPIIIAPYVGEHTAFDASDLVVNYSSYNEDLRLLQLKQHVYQQYLLDNHAMPETPLLMISGKVEGQGIYSKPSPGNTTSKVNLTSAELDVTPILNQWASGFISLRYLNGYNANSTMPPVTLNTSVNINKAFLTIGNLNKLPVYATIGQFMVPFGAYTSSMIATDLPGAVFETKAQGLLVGYQGANGEGPYAQVFAFNGDTNTNHNNNINDIGANLGFSASKSAWNTDASIGAIANVADSMGFQQTGISPVLGFPGFSVSPASEVLRHQVPGVAAHWNFGAGPFSLATEYITATKDFDMSDMSFNGRAARPAAMNVEGIYNFHMLDKPAALSAGYQKTWDSLAIFVPEKRYTAAFTTSVWKDTIEELEYQHNIGYKATDSAAAGGFNISPSINNVSSNVVTAQFGVYF